MYTHISYLCLARLEKQNILLYIRTKYLHYWTIPKSTLICDLQYG